MKTKEIAFTLPLMVLLYEFIFFNGNRKKRLIRLLPLLLTLLIIPLGMLDMGVSADQMLGALEKETFVRKDIPRAAYLFTEMRVMLTYLRLLVLPVGQNLDYDYPLYGSFAEPPVFLSFIFLLLLLSLVLYMLYRHSRKVPEVLVLLWIKKEH